MAAPDGPRGAAGPVAGDDNALSAQALLGANALSYRLPPDLSLATQRNVQSNFFATNNPQPGSIAVCTLNTGSSYVDFKHSILYVDIVFTLSGGTGTDFLGWGANGSACNILNRVLITSRSGTVCERLDNSGQLASARLFMERSGDWVSTAASMMGAGVTSVMLQSASGAVTYRYALPCNMWSVALGGTDVLWPAALCSGMRLELLLESSANALVGNTTGLTMSYAISSIRLDLVCVQLSDFAARALNQMASTSSLELVTTTAQNTQATRTAATLNVDNGRACSRALMFLFRERPISGSASNFDHFKCMTVDASFYPTEWQCRVGSLYFPQSSIRGGGPFAAPIELYATSMQALGKLTGLAPATNLTVYKSDRFQIWQTLERDGAIDGSGVPLANSRLLSVAESWNAPPNGGASLIDFFLFYTTLIRVYLTGSNVEV